MCQLFLRVAIINLELVGFMYLDYSQYLRVLLYGLFVLMINIIIGLAVIFLVTI